MRNLKWFQERIGKRIFRNPDNCKCPVCEDVVENGLIVVDSFHAEYLYMIQGEWKSEGTILNYRDKKQK